MFDPARKQLVFRGTASGTLSDKPEQNAKKISKAMEKNQITNTTWPVGSGDP